MQTCVNTVHVYRLREAIPVYSVLLLGFFFLHLIVLAPYVRMSLFVQTSLWPRSVHLQKKSIVSQPLNEASAHNEHLFVIIGHK